MYTDPYGLWSSGFSAYLGAGGGFTFGVDPNDGGFFLTLSFGFGLGESVNLYTPGGSRPGSKPGDCSHQRIGVDLFAGASANIGPVGAGIGGNVGRTFFPAVDKDSELHNGISPSAGAEWAWKQQIQAAAGGQITFGYAH
jgi:hypothetical protein